MSWPHKHCDYYLDEPTEQDVSEGRTSCVRYENAAGECRSDFCPFGRPVVTKIPEPLEERIDE